MTTCCGTAGGRCRELGIVTPPPLHDHLRDEIPMQRAMIADMKLRAGTATGHEVARIFDHYARAMLCVHEVMVRAGATP